MVENVGNRGAYPHGPSLGMDQTQQTRIAELDRAVSYLSFPGILLVDTPELAMWVQFSLL